MVLLRLDGQKQPCANIAEAHMRRSGGNVAWFEFTVTMKKTQKNSASPNHSTDRLN